MSLSVQHIEFLRRMCKSADAQQPSPGAQAMMAASKINPASGNAQFTPIQTEQQPADNGGGDLAAAEEKHRAELDKKEQENKELQAQLDAANLENAKHKAMQDLERQHDANMSKLEKEKQQLEARKVQMNADEESHQATLRQQEAEQKVRIAEEKAEAMKATADDSAKQHIQLMQNVMKGSQNMFSSQFQQIFKEKDDLLKKKEQAMQQAQQSAQPGTSLSQHTMQRIADATSAAKNLTKLRARLQGMQGVYMSESPTYQPGMKMAAAATPPAPTPNPTPAPQAQAGSGGATNPAPAPKPVQPTQPTQQPGYRPVAPQPAQQSTAGSSDMAKDLLHTSVDQAKQQWRQQHGYGTGGASDGAIALAQSQNTLRNLSATGMSTDTYQNSYLNDLVNDQAKFVNTTKNRTMNELGVTADINKNPELFRQQMHAAYENDPTKAEDLARLDDLNYKRKRTMFGDARSKLDEISNATADARAAQNSWGNKAWYDPRSWAHGLGSFAEGIVMNPINAVNDARQAARMALVRGSDMNWFNSDSNMDASRAAFNNAARAAGLNATIGGNALNTGLSALDSVGTLSMFIPGVGLVGGTALKALGAAGRLGSVAGRQALKQGLRTAVAHPIASMKRTNLFHNKFRTAPVYGPGANAHSAVDSVANGINRVARGIGNSPIGKAYDAVNHPLVTWPVVVGRAGADAASEFVQGTPFFPEFNGNVGGIPGGPEMWNAVDPGVYKTAAAGLRPVAADPVPEAKPNKNALTFDSTSANTLNKSLRGWQESNLYDQDSTFRKWAPKLSPILSALTGGAISVFPQTTEGLIGKLNTAEAAKNVNAAAAARLHAPLIEADSGRNRPFGMTKDHLNLTQMLKPFANVDFSRPAANANAF